MTLTTERSPVDWHRVSGKHQRSGVVFRAIAPKIPSVR